MDCSPLGSSVHGLSQQENPFPSLGDLPNPGIKPVSLACHVLADRFFTSWATRETNATILNKTDFLKKPTYFLNIDNLSWVWLGQEDLPHPRRGNGNTPVFLPGESHGQRYLAGYSPRGCKESDTTDRLTLSLSNLKYKTWSLDLEHEEIKSIKTENDLEIQQVLPAVPLGSKGHSGSTLSPPRLFFLTLCWPLVSQAAPAAAGRAGSAPERWAVIVRLVAGEFLENSLPARTVSNQRTAD